MNTDNVIETILSRFDFEKVANVMEYMQWSWYTGQPTAAQLETTARSLLQWAEKRLNSENTAQTSTGGLYVVAERFGEDKFYNLSFRIMDVDIDDCE